MRITYFSIIRRLPADLGTRGRRNTVGQSSTSVFDEQQLIHSIKRYVHKKETRQINKILIFQL